MYQMNPYARAQVPQNNILWVQGIEGAKAQQVQPGSTLLLLDSDSDHFYIKACDQYGICLPIRTYRFEEEIAMAPIVATPAAADLSNYVTKEELQQLIKELKQTNEQPVQSSKYITTKQPSSDSEK